MFSVALAADGDPRRLARTLAALVPAAAEGYLRDVVVAAGPADADARRIADALGCEIVGGTAASAIAACRGPWVMFLTPGSVPEGYWYKDAMAFHDRHARRSTAVLGVFRLATDDPDWRSRLIVRWKGTKRGAAAFGRFGPKAAVADPRGVDVLRLPARLLLASNADGG